MKIPGAAIAFWLVGAAVAAAQPLEYESDLYASAEAPFEYASVYTMKGATSACPDEDDTLPFYDALRAQDEAQMNYYVYNRECLVVFDGSHGDVIGATLGGGTQLRVRFRYLHKYRNQPPVELDLQVYDLRGQGGRSDRLDDTFKKIMSRHPVYGDQFRAGG